MEIELGRKYRLKVLPDKRDYRKIDTGAGFVGSMWEFRGCILVVTDVPEEGNPILRLPNGEDYYFSPNWLEPVNKFKGNK